MKVRNNKTKKEYHLTDEAYDKLKSKGLAGRYTVVSEVKKATFQPRELKVESMKETKKEETKKSE